MMIEMRKADVGDRVITVVPSRPEYAEAMHRLMFDVYHCTEQDCFQIFTAEQYRHHIAIFPEGQFVAIDGTPEEAETDDDLNIVGTTVSMRVHYDASRPQPFVQPWWRTIDGGWLRHEPDGEWLYGVESHVHQVYRGRGVGGLLMQARRDRVRALNLRGILAGSALISYAEYADRVSPETYVQGVAEGRFYDTNLTKQLAMGFRLAGPVIPDYVLDVTALGWGALIVWPNPHYDPARSTHTVPAHTAPRRYTAALRPPRAARPRLADRA
jgi:GNAT superfamily N-acetyltransferase